MKKRSLLVATSMLLIAILACTSATYAWFSRSARAQVGELELQVKAANGLALRLEETGYNFGQLDQNTFTTEANYNLPTNMTNNSFATDLVDISMVPTADGVGRFCKPNTWADTGEPTVFEEANKGSDYTYFQFYITNLDGTAKSVKVNGSLNDNGGVYNNENFARIALVVGNNTDTEPFIFDNAGEQVTAAVAYDGADYTQDGTVQAIDLTGNATTIYANLAPNATVLVKAYIYVEGSDAQCTFSSVASLFYATMNFEAGTVA